MAARPKKDSTPTRKPAFDAAGRIVTIFGESPLVEEYAVRCLGRGYSVQIRFNPSPDSPRGRVTEGLIPKGARAVSRPAPETHCALELTNTSSETKRKNLQDLDRGLKPATPILSSSVVSTVLEQALEISRPGRLIGIGAIPSLLDGGLMEFAGSRHTDENTVAEARRFAESLEKEFALVGDAPGMVLPRVLCMLVNEACFAVAEGVATGSDIDTAMKLGVNYPRGPVEWAERIGARQVLSVIEALHGYFGEDRYRPAPLLRRAALVGSFDAS